MRQDRMSFVHVATTDDAEGRNPLTELAAFKEFSSGIRERCEEQPVTSKVRIPMLRLLQSLIPITLGLARVLPAQSSSPAASSPPAYPPLREYLMTKEAELALARSAAPANITGRATIKLLTESGYKVAREGDNGFVCLVMRGWSAPTFTPAPFRDLVYDPKVRAPICFNPVAARTVLPYQELRAKLAMEGKTPDQIAARVQSAYAKGELPRMEGVAFAYMWSADQYLAPGIGAWHPHIMVYTPYYTNAMLGGNDFAGATPFVSDDAGTPFAVTVIPVDHGLAMRAR